jgi:hypothetical protein
MEASMEQMQSVSTELAPQPPHSLIESDSVEGATVYGVHNRKIGTIKRLVIEKVSGRVVYAVISFGGFLGLGEELFTVPWGKLSFDKDLDGFRTDLDEAQVSAAPRSSILEHPDWSDRERERALHRHYEVPPYWGF